MEQEKLKKVVEAAKLYYLLDYNQNDIAKKLGVSRPTVSRLLQQAKEEGIVEIKINDPAEDIQQLAKQLEQKFNLKKAIVVSVPEHQDGIIKKYLGKEAAEYLRSIVKDGDVIGVIWGTTLYHVALQLRHKHVKDVKVVQLKGGVSLSETNTFASDILHFLEAHSMQRYITCLSRPSSIMSLSSKRWKRIATFVKFSILDDKRILLYLRLDQLNRSRYCSSLVILQKKICKRFIQKQLVTFVRAFLIKMESYVVKS